MTSVGKDYVFTLVLVHIVRFGSITQSLWYWYTMSYRSGYCCGAGAGHLGTEAVCIYLAVKIVQGDVRSDRNPSGALMILYICP